MATGTNCNGEARVAGLILHMALEVDDQSWKLAFGTGLRRQSRERRVRPRGQEAILQEIEAARRRFGLPTDARVVSCYEAGREGFWLHRWLESEGVDNLVVDSSSIEVKRRARRAKADRLDVVKLLRMLVRYQAGERGVWSVVRVPTVEAEDARHLHRELTTAKRDRVRVTNRIKGLLATQGIRLEVWKDFAEWLEELRLWDGSPLPAGLWARLERAWQQREWLTARIRVLESERRELLRTSQTTEVEQVRQLMLLDGIGQNSAWVFVTELFGWRQFRNRGEVGAIAGLVPSPYQSGAMQREQGISKAGNRHVRAMVVQVAWGWLRHQPESDLSRWYNRRFGSGGPRMRKVGIVALARRLLVDLWRYLETGAIPEGARLNA
jgi:transposase